MPVIYVRKSTDDPILLAADRMAPKLRDAFLAAVEAARSKVSLGAISAAISSGDVNRIMDLIGEALAGALAGKGIVAGVASVRDALQGTFAAGAKAAVVALPKAVGIDLSFDLLSPEAVKFLDSYTMDLIREMEADTRGAINAAITRSFGEGGKAASAARDVRDMIGLTERQEQAIANYRKALESGNAEELRAALERALRDGRYDRGVINALNGGKGLSQARIDQMVERYRERYLKYRADMIARTESIRAASAGQRESWRQAREQGLIPDGSTKRWVTSGDDRTCDQCDALDGEEVDVDDEFPEGDPPIHPSCRCGVVLKIKRGAKAA